jgi:large subunit ribosomal protein L24
MAKIRKGDQVVVISGAQRGRTGDVLKVWPDSGRVLVDGINVRVKHQKKTSTKQSGLEKAPRPIAISNVSLIRPGSKNKSTRVGFELKKDAKIRVAVQAGRKEVK